VRNFVRSRSDSRVDLILEIKSSPLQNELILIHFDFPSFTRARATRLSPASRQVCAGRRRRRGGIPPFETPLPPRLKKSATSPFCGDYRLATFTIQEFLIK
jgi:hypothetical protein